MNVEKIARSCALRASEESDLFTSVNTDRLVLAFARRVAQRAVELAADQIRQAAYADGFKDGYEERNEALSMELD